MAKLPLAGPQQPPAPSAPATSRLAERLERLRGLLATFAAASEVDEVAGLVTGPLAESVGAAAAGFGIVHTEVAEVELLSVRPGGDGEARRISMEAPTPVASVARNGEELLIASPSALLARFPDARVGPASWAFLPISAPDRTLAVASLGFGSPDALDADTLAFVRAALEGARHALERLRLRDALLRQVEERERVEAEALRLNGDLQRQVTEFQTLLAMLPLGVAFAHDPACSVVTTNAHLARLLDVSDGTNVSSNEAMPYTLKRDGVAVRATTPLETATRTGREVRDFEAELEREDGTRSHLLVHAAPLRDELGVVNGALAAFVDITRQRLDTERLSTIIDEMPVMMNAFDADGRLVMWNKECERVTGYQATELVGRKDWMELLYPDPAERAAMFEQWRESDGRYRDVPWNVCCKDGTIRTISWSSISRDVPIEGWASWDVGVDVTAARDAMEAIRKSEARFQLVAHATGEAAWEWNLETNETWWSPLIESAFGYPETSVPTTFDEWSDRIHPDDRARVHDGLRRALAGESLNWSDEYRFQRADGTYAHVHDRGEVLLDARGRPARMVGSIVDISARKAEQEASHRREARLARHNDALVGLAREGTLQRGLASLQALATAAGEAIGVARVGIWLLRGDRLRCEAFHGDGLEPTGVELATADYPRYIAALEESRTIAAHDARVDPRTAEFTESYLDPIGITSMLDAPVRVGGRLVGVVCHEHIGEPRGWSAEEQTFAGSIADLVALALEAERRLRIQEALRESEARFRAVVEALPTIIWSARPDGYLDFYNQRWLDYTGLTHAETEGWGWKKVIHPDDVERTVELWSNAVKTGSRYEIEYRYRRHDGEYRWHLGRAVPQCDENGVVVRWFGSATDIDDHKLAQEALRESETRFRTLADTAPVLIWMSDETKARTYFNRGWLEFTGSTLDAQTGDGWSKGIHAADLAPYMHVHDTAFDGREPFSIEYRLQRHDGEYRWLYDRATPRYRADGSFAGYIGSSIDITQRREAERELDLARRQLAHSEKLAAMGTLVSGVAHEIRTPLAYMNNSAHILLLRLQRALEERPDLENVVSRLSEPASSIIEGVERIDRLVGDLRRFMRPDVAERALLPFDDVVAGAIRLFDATHRGGVTVTATLSSGARLHLDKVQIEQVVLNLLENAGHAAPPGTRVRIATERAETGARLVVEDEGPGVPAEVRDRIFDPFFTTKSEGTGLGLSIVQRIVEAHHGKVRCESRPGGGARFVVSLP